MTTYQRNGYFRRWTAACKCQGWSALSTSERDQLRHREQAVALSGLVLSSTELTEAQIDSVFAHFDVLAQTVKLDSAIQSNLPPVGNDNPRRNKANHAIIDPGRVRRWKWVIFHRQIPALKRCGIADPMSYVESICRDKYSTNDPERLDAWEVYQLMITLVRCIKRLDPTDAAVATPAPKSNPLPENAENPF